MDAHTHPAEQAFFLTPAEFMARYRVARTQFYQLANAGQFPVVKLGRSSRIPVDAADAWARSLDARTPEPVQ